MTATANGHRADAHEFVRTLTDWADAYQPDPRTPLLR
jgi:hypothetical protein